MTTWRKELEYWLNRNGEGWGNINFCTLTANELDTNFGSHGGKDAGIPFLVWTSEFVYFSKEDEYHECTSIGYVPRNPCNNPRCIN